MLEGGRRPRPRAAVNWRVGWELTGGHLGGGGDRRRREEGASRVGVRSEGAPAATNQRVARPAGPPTCPRAARRPEELPAFGGARSLGSVSRAGPRAGLVPAPACLGRLLRSELSHVRANNL